MNDDHTYFLRYASHTWAPDVPPPSFLLLSSYGNSNTVTVKVSCSETNIGAEAARLFNLEDCGAVLDVLQKHGHNEIDTARVYGASEELLGQLQWQSRGIVMDTKLNPRRFGPKAYSHKKQDLKRGISDSLEALRADQIDLWYLHTPDVSLSSVSVF